LVVSTNYVTTLAATATVDGAARPAAVFPIDGALTGIAVPRGATTTARPVPVLPWWSRAAAIVGIVMLAGCLVATRHP
jgi:hypothetical protein